MNIVGLDLSLTATGVATEAGTEVLSTSLRGCERLAWLRYEVLEAVGVVHYDGWEDESGAADLVVIEGYAYGRPNQAHQIGELGGVIRLALHETDIPWVEVPPAVLKKYATGHGNAGKGEVMAAAIRRLDYQGHDDNEADALWLRQMAIDAYGVTVPSAPMPATHREALAKTDWPELPASDLTAGEGQTDSRAAGGHL